MAEGETRSAFHKAAIAFAREGIPVFPCAPNSKVPVTPRGFHDATTDLAQIDKWWAEDAARNVAFCPHSVGWGIIDVDGQEGEAALAKLQEEAGDLPPTYEVRTPRGGRHLYFEGELPMTAWRPGGKRTLGEHIDTRGVGSYALVPPSVTPNGTYTVLEDRDLAPVPTWVGEWLKRTAQAAPAVIDELDLRGNVSRARSLLESYAARSDVAVEGNGGNSRTYQLACELHNLGLSSGRSIELIEEVWNPACKPPWSRGELEAIVSHASQYAQNEPGAWAVGSTERIFGETVDRLSVDTKSQPADDLISLYDLIDGPPAPSVRELVPGLIERGIVTFLSAPGGSGKSRLAMQIGLCIGTGLPVFGRSPDSNEPVTFVYLSYEDRQEEITRRAQQIAKQLALPPGGAIQLWNKQRSPEAFLSVTNAGEFIKHPFFNRFIDRLRSINGHKFVVVDSTYNVLDLQGQSKINETAVKNAIGMLDILCDVTDSTMLVLWHPSQAGHERGDASGWSVAWHNAPRARLSLDADEKAPDTYELSVVKRNNARKGKPITLHWQDGVLLPRSEIAAAEQQSLLMDACIKVALDAVNVDAPITRQRKLSDYQMDQIEKLAGFRPTQGQIKELLWTAVLVGRLRYVAGRSHQKAGYFAVDDAEADPHNRRIAAMLEQKSAQKHPRSHGLR